MASVRGYGCVVVRVVMNGLYVILYRDMVLLYRACSAMLCDTSTVATLRYATLRYAMPCHRDRDGESERSAGGAAAAETSW